MDIFPQAFGVLSSAVVIANSVPYVLSVYKNVVRPQRTTWLIWTVLNLIFIATNIAEGASYSILFLIVSTFFSVAIMTMAWKKSADVLQKREKISLGLAGLGLILWWITNDPLYALVLSLFVDSLGGLLNIHKTYLDPWGESYFFWTTNILVGVLAALAVGRVDYFLLAFPVYLTIVATIMSVTIVSRRRLVEKPEL